MIIQNPSPVTTIVELDTPGRSTIVAKLGTDLYSIQNATRGTVVEFPTGCHAEIRTGKDIHIVDDIRPRLRLGDLANQVRIRRKSEKIIVREGCPKLIRGLGWVTYMKSGWFTFIRPKL